MNTDIASIAAQVENWVLSRPSGTVFFLSDIDVNGTYDAKKSAIHMLIKEKVITRVTSGIYVFPIKSPLIGELLPSIDEVAKAIARRDNIQLQPSGAVALNKLGLSTQVPMKHVYYTNGTPRQLKIGKSTLTFKAKSPKSISQSTELGALLVAALKELGEDRITPAIIEQLKKAAKQMPAYELVKDIKSSPLWMHKFFTQIISNDDEFLDT